MKLFKGFEIRKSLSWPFALGWGALALGLILGGGPGAVLANSENKKGYNYAKLSIVTTILNVNYTKFKLPLSQFQPR